MDAAPPLHWNGGARLALLTICIAAGYYLLARLSLLFMAGHTGIATIWPGNGLVLGVMMVMPRRTWPAMIVAIVVGQQAAYYHVKQIDVVSFGFTVANVLEVLFAATALDLYFRRRLFRFTSVSEVLAFATFACIGACTLSAVIGAATATLTGLSAFWESFRLWLVVDALGLLVVTPVVVTFCTQRPVWPGPFKAAEAALGLTLFAVCCVLLFGDQGEHRMLVMTFPHVAVLPFLLWAALRFDPRVSALASMILVIVSAWNTVNARGPLVREGYSLLESIVAMQASAMLWGLSALTLAAATAERVSSAAASTESERRAREAERQANESRARLEAVFDNTAPVIFMKDPNFRYIAVNRTFERICCTSKEKVVGRTDHEVFPSEIADFFREQDIRILQTGQTIEFDSPWVVEGVQRLYKSIKFPLINPEGEVWAICGMSTDVTEQKNYENELHRAKEEAESANRAKSEFLANISHEIRTPLTSIFGYADLLLGSDLQSADRIDHIQTIRRNGEHLLAVLNDVLDMSKIEAGRMTIETVRCSAPQIVAEVTSLMRQRASARFLELHVKCRSPIPTTITSDPTRLRQILFNILGNAIKFTETGRIDVELWTEDRESGSDLLIEVRDTGIGMTPAQVTALGQPFRQADPSHARRFGGSGLGISICYRLAELMGGTIQCQSTRGVGTTFTVRLPTGDLTGVSRVRSLEAEVIRAVEPAESPMNGRVLIAEDAPDTRRLLTLYLRRVGVESEVAENGKAAVARAMGAWHSGRPYDVILMDMQMPEMDGATAVSILRERGYTGTIVAVTANAMENERRQCLEVGCDDFIPKPIQAPLFIESLKKHLAKARPSMNTEKVRFSLAAVNQAEPAVIASSETGRLTSQLARDPDIGPLLPEYLSELAAKAMEIGRALGQQDWQAIARLSHQIKGSAGGYGFPIISDAAGRLETLCKTSAPRDEISAEVTELLNLCQRATQATPGPLPR